MTSTKKQFKAVFFDLGGTLFSYGDLSEPFNNLLLNQLTIQGIEEKAGQARSKYRRAMLEAFRAFDQKSFYLHSELFVRGYRNFLLEYELESTESQGLDFYKKQIELGVRNVKPRKDAINTIQILHEADLKMGIVSNIDDDQFHPLWARMNLSQWIPYTTTSQEARSCKPDSKIFKLAMNKLDNPEPHRCIFVGDSPEHDIRGANSLGIHSIWITSNPARSARLDYRDKPDFTIRHLSELLKIALR